MEQITINLLATGETPVCHVSQFDEDRVVRINLKKGAEVYTLSGTETVKMRIRKPDDTERVVDITNTSSSYVDYVSVPEDCDIEGVNVCELVIDDLGSKNFLMNVEEDAYGGGADIETLTASGPVATFETNLVDNLVDLKAEITPIQDLHGYDNPWPAGGGKNLLDKSSYGYISNANIIWGGTVQGYADGSLNLRAGTYTLSVSVACTGLYVSDTESQIAVSYNKAFITFTIAEDKAIKLMVYKSGITQDDLLSYNYQLEVGSTATDWTPYSNICPISGHTEAKIVHSGKNLLDTRQESIPQYAGGSGVYANVTYTPNNDGSITINGTSTGTSVLFFDPVTLNPLTSYPFPTWKYTNNRYTFSVTDGWRSVTGDAYIQATVKKIKDDSIVSKQRLTASVFTRSFTVGEDEYISDAFIRLSSGASASNINIKIQLELGSVATDYEPYTGTEVTVQFGQTVYKGKLYSKQRKVLVTSILVDLGDFSWYHSISGTRNYFYVPKAQFAVEPKGVPPGQINEDTSSQYRRSTYTNVVNGLIDSGFNIASITKYLYLYDKTKLDMTTDEFRAAVAGVKLLYEIETPIEIPLSAISQFETLLGINNVYASTGDTEVKYLKQV